MTDDTLEAYNKLKDNGTFDKIDKLVFEIIKRSKPIDAQQAHKIIVNKGYGYISYNLVQQGFTRLKNDSKIFKVGTHKGASGFTRGLYSDEPINQQQGELFC